MTKNKLYFWVFVLGVLFLSTGQALMMMCGVLMVLLYPMEAFVDWSSDIE